MSIIVSCSTPRLVINEYIYVGFEFGIDMNKMQINEGSTIYASAVANKVIEVVDQHHMAALPINKFLLLG